MNKNSAYILGTDQVELFRLGVQHQVWAEEAQRGWRSAQLRSGQTFLDLGCGPGYCTKELAFLAGAQGKVIGVDKSESYIQFLKQISAIHHLNIEAIVSDFDSMNLIPESIDGMYCRWALAWIRNPKEILAKVIKTLKPNGKMVLHEYYDWSTLQTEPRKEALAKAIAMALKSFKESDMDIDIGRRLPALLIDLNMKILSVRPMSKIATMENGIWQWPKTFFESYFPRLVTQKYLTPKEAAKALSELQELEEIKGASICTCLMIEIIAEKQ